MDEKIVEIEVNGLKEKFTFGKVARQADGSVLYQQGKAVLLGTVTVDYSTPIEEDFLPLTVQYLERAYAVSKIPGGFVKRESKPSDFETLTARIIDRSLRPLFPDNFPYPVVITVMVLSGDKEVDLQIAALHCANAALLTSSLPVTRSVAGVRVGRDENGFILNPKLSELEAGKLDLLLVGSKNEMMMIELAVKATKEIISEFVDTDPIIGIESLPELEWKVNELKESDLIDLIKKYIIAIEDASKNYDEKLLPFKKPQKEIDILVTKVPENIELFVKEHFKEKIFATLEGLSKSERAGALDEIIKEAIELAKEKEKDYDESQIKKAIEELKSNLVREQILKQRVRADGRALDEVRPITIETNILPSVHGSCLFRRGETQALVTATLGDSKDAQMYELLNDYSPRMEHFMVHYNFPGFSVGEAKPLGAPSRRELGHGNLAKRALEPVVELDGSQTIRVVSEILESNGSSSMATVCGGALALYSAEVELKKMVAGVAMGLMTGENGEYAILTDIMGLEDHDGDVDLKVAGTRDGITAMQMDIKLGGLDLEILKEALLQAKEAREKILDIMEEAKGLIKPSGALPTTEHFFIDPSKIVHVIGKAGATIKEIIEKFGVSIDLDRTNGGVKVSGQDKENVLKAKEHIENIANTAEEINVPTYEAGKHYKGIVKKIVDFGVFVELPGGYDALLHISKISKGRVYNLEQLFKVGDEIDVVVLEQRGKKVELATLEYVS
jgi:polyribonucleotide nucleotidyltransferase